MWHTTCTQENQGDSWLLVIGSQIANLIPNPSCGHNLCFEYPIGSCEPILDIYIPITLQWYKEKFPCNEFWPLKSPSEDSEVHQNSDSRSGSSFGSVGVHSLILSYNLGSMKCDSHVHSWPASWQAFALVVSPRLRLWQMPCHMVGGWKEC